ncbi:MAG: 16S rRNA (adenine(1518)-N(6)/adenine(1519)-N(6))-dimethyltransferase RsmA [Thermoanaerobacterales bacterium]|nr:16S rRNA (adenine(1518)-N(6)/adenine(1519)-N(6))-dimethyltransferase RsmA [Thermoanaerobacterales bacterium]
MSDEVLSPTRARALLARHGLRPKKALGQNYLVNAGVLDKVVAAVDVRPGETVIEIGPGLGALTRRLADAGARVIALELDRDLLPVLAETLGDRPGVEVVAADATRIDFGALLRERGLEGPYKVAANLPYYVTTPIIIRLLEASPAPRRAVVMVQKEVAERLVASPGTKAYGALSVLVQFYTEPSLVCRVSPGSFFPPPAVDSAVVALARRARPAVDVPDPAAFFRLVRAAFGQRRKVLPKALEGAGLGGRETWARLMRREGLDPGRRGETLSLEEFGRLVRAWFALQGGKAVL